MMGLLIYKYEPFWQEVSGKSLILRWPLRPVGLLFVIANTCVRKHGEKNCITKFQNTIYASIIQNNLEQSENLQTYFGKISMVFCSKDLLLVLYKYKIWQQLFCVLDAYYVFLHLESRIRSNDSIPASLNAIKRTFVAIIWGIWFFFLLLELRQHHSHMEVITWFV